MAAVAGDDHVSAARPDPRVPAGEQVRVAGVTGEPLEPPGQRQPVPLCDPAGPADVPPREVGVSPAGRRPGEFLKPLDALCGDVHDGGFSAAAFRRSVIRSQSPAKR